jgi:predicted DNA-binding transcriptional regulator AlpA
MNAPEQLLNSDETAKLLATTPHYLAYRRWKGDHDLPHVRIGRKVRYRLSDVLEYLDRNTVKN